MHPFVSPNQPGLRLTALLAGVLLALAGASAGAQLPTVSSRTETWTGTMPPSDREAFERAQWEQWQLQRERERRQRELTRQQDAPIFQKEESIGQRALREQAQNRREQGRVSSGDRR